MLVKHGWKTTTPLAAKRTLLMLLLALFGWCGAAQLAHADTVPTRALLPWRAQMEQRMNQQNRLIEILLQRLQQPPQSTPQPIVIPGPLQQLPIGGEPKQQLPIGGEPKQQLPIGGEPKQKLPIGGEPKQPLPIGGEPKQKLPPSGQPQQPLPIQPQSYTLFIRALYRR